MLTRAPSLFGVIARRLSPVVPRAARTTFPRAQPLLVLGHSSASPSPSSSPLASRLPFSATNAFSQSFVRAAHTIPRPPPRQAATAPKHEPATADAPKSEGERPELKDPAFYQLSFTCVPCGHRSHHNVSKQGYHKGSTLITCPSCRNRHVISDHLNIFGDRKITIEDLMREKGQLVKRGSLGEDGDVEFWPDETLDDQRDGSGADKVGDSS